MKFGLLRSLKYMVVYGDFLSDKSKYIPDLKHFNGNKTWFSDFRINDFKNLDYCAYSTDGPYVEVHTDKLDQYFEFSIGVEKLGLLRAELFTSLINGINGTIGFLFGIKKTFGN